MKNRYNMTEVLRTTPHQIASTSSSEYGKHIGHVVITPPSMHPKARPVHDVNYIAKHVFSKQFQRKSQETPKTQSVYKSTYTDPASSELLSPSLAQSKNNFEELAKMRRKIMGHMNDPFNPTIHEKTVHKYQTTYQKEFPKYSPEEIEMLNPRKVDQTCVSNSVPRAMLCETVKDLLHQLQDIDVYENHPSFESNNTREESCSDVKENEEEIEGSGLAEQVTVEQQ